MDKLIPNIIDLTMGATKKRRGEKYVRRHYPENSQKNFINTASKRFQNGFKTASKRFRNGFEMVSKRLQNGFENASKRPRLGWISGQAGGSGLVWFRLVLGRFWSGSVPVSEFQIFGLVWLLNIPVMIFR